MGRPRRPIAPCDDARRALLTWVHTLLDEWELTYRQLAQVSQYDRSWISRALSGRHMPPWRMIEQIATRCSADSDTAWELWTAADAARQREHRTRTRRTKEYPPANLSSYSKLIQALRNLVEGLGISQRELVQRDETGLLRRSTIGAVLSMRRSARRDVMIAIVRACGVPDAAVEHWAAAWDRLGAPNRQAMEQRRRLIAYSVLRARSHWWGGAW